MKKIKILISMLLCAVMVLGTVAVGGDGFAEVLDAFSVKASATKVTSFSRGDIIEFGWYPQRKVTDSTLISALNCANGDWKSYGYYSGTGDWSDGQMKPSDYMRYKDVSYNGSKYRAVTFDSYRPYYTGYTSSASKTDQDDNGYKTGNVYWFKYEPIKWRVLNPATGMVMAETILDSQIFNNYILSSGKDGYGITAYWGDSSKTYYANNYTESSIRKWLNDDFYNTAFSSAQQNIIQNTTLDNSAYSTKYSKYNSESTNDKIYLLSWNDALNTSYGFSSSDSTTDTSRRAKGSDYAKCQGMSVFSVSPYDGNSSWLLRSPGFRSNSTCGVDHGGRVYYVLDTYSTGTDGGVRPALNFNLSSDIFQSDVKDTGNNSLNHQGICLAELECTAEGHYTGNQGDARVYKLDGTEFLGYAPKGCNNALSRYGNKNLNGEVLKDGFEVWIARWNFGDNISWAYRTFKLDKKFKTLNGSTDIIKSYNTNNFDSTLYFYDGERLIDSFQITPQNYKIDFSIDVSGVDELKVLVKDNVKTAGGTSFAIHNLILDEPVSSNVTGIFENYTLEVIKNTDKSYVSEIIVDGKKYPVSENLKISESEADNLKGKTVILDLENGFVIEICEDSRTTIDFDEPIIDNIHYGANYHNYETEIHRATSGSISNYANTFYSAMDYYYSTFRSVANSEIGYVNIKRLAKQIKEKDEATSDRYITMQSGTPSDCMDSVYYVLTLFLSDVFNDNVDIGDIDFSGDLTQNDAKVVNAVKSGMSKSGAFEKKYGGYTVTFNTVNMWGAFAGSVTADDGSGHTYTGTITSTYSGTVNVINEYLKEMSDVVKDAHKKALFSIISEFKSVVGISKYTDEELENFLKDLVKSVSKKKLGKDILLTFKNIRHGYKAYNDVAKMCRNGNISISDAKDLYNQLDSISFSANGIADKVLADALKSVEEARKRFKDDVYNYIYGIEPEKKPKFGETLMNFFGFKCPVEFEVYDKDGNLLGYVDSSDKHDEYVWYDDSIYIYVDGDAKYIYVPADKKINIVFTGLSDGTMDYTIERLDKGVGTGRLNYYDVPLSAGCTYTQAIPANMNLEAVNNAPKLSGSSIISANEYLSAENQSAHISVTGVNDNGGYVSGAGLYPVGELVKTIAVPVDGYDFVGWYVDNELVETSEIYRFVAKDNIEVTAKFEKHLEINNYRVIEGAENTNGYAEVIECGNSNVTIRFRSDVIDAENSNTIKIKLSDSNDSVISEILVPITKNEDGSFTTKEFVCAPDSKIEMYDSEDSLILKVSAEDNEVVLVSINIDETELEVNSGDAVELSCLPNPLNAALTEVTWTSSDEIVAIVDELGNVTPISEGTAVITASCGKLTSSCVINVVKHEHSFSEKVTNPTCSEQGYTTYTCSCGETYKDNYVSALGHNYVDGICSRCTEKSPERILNEAKAEAKQELEKVKQTSISDEAKATVDTAISNIDKETSVNGVATAKSNGITAAANADKDLADAKTAAKSEFAAAKNKAKSDEAKAAIDTAIANVDKATNLDDVATAKSNGITAAANADKALADAKTAAKSEFAAAKNKVKSDEAKAAIDTAIANVDKATNLDDVDSAKSAGITAATNADKALADAKTAAKSELAAAKNNAKSDEAKAAIDTAIANVDKATSLNGVAEAKANGLTNADNADKSYADKIKFDNVSIKTATEKTIDYRSIVTITATATDVPEGYHLALYVNGSKVKDGDNKSVSYTYGEIKSDINYTVKIVDSNGNVQKDSSGNDLSKDSRVTVNAGFFKKLVAFFKGLFGALPKVEVKP